MERKKSSVQGGRVWRKVPEAWLGAWCLCKGACEGGNSLASLRQHVCGVTHVTHSLPYSGPTLLRSGCLQALRFCTLPDTLQLFLFFFFKYECRENCWFYWY